MLGKADRVIRSMSGAVPIALENPSGKTYSHLEVVPISASGLQG